MHYICIAAFFTKFSLLRLEYALNQRRISAKVLTITHKLALSPPQPQIKYSPKIPL
jgi:hypothetical protein